MFATEANACTKRLNPRLSVVHVQWLVWLVCGRAVEATRTAALTHASLATCSAGLHTAQWEPYTASTVRAAVLLSAVFSRETIIYQDRLGTNVRQTHKGTALYRR